MSVNTVDKPLAVPSKALCSPLEEMLQEGNTSVMEHHSVQFSTCAMARMCAGALEVHDVFIFFLFIIFTLVFSITSISNHTTLGDYLFMGLLVA